MYRINYINAYLTSFSLLTTRTVTSEIISDNLLINQFSTCTVVTHLTIRRRTKNSVIQYVLYNTYTVVTNFRDNLAACANH